MKKKPFVDLNALATNLRHDLESRECVLLFAYNGTGKTRLSMEFKDAGKRGDRRDTLYFNAFTEDLFTWDNDLEGDSERVLKLNSTSHFFDGLEELEMENRIRPFLHRYADFDFKIDYGHSTIRFLPSTQREAGTEVPDCIKVSRGEENIFVWCFFLAVAELAMDGESAYQWVKYIYIDDPVSSLDENHATAVASDLAHLLLQRSANLKAVISTHHSLFFNVLYNALRKKKNFLKSYFLSKDRASDAYVLHNTGDTPFFHHVAMLKELYLAEQSGEIYTYHFNMLRTLLEKSASFHGFKDFSDCIDHDASDPDDILHARLINLLSHGNYSLYEPREMLEENKDYFRKILNDFLSRYPFNPELFREAPDGVEES